MIHWINVVGIRCGDQRRGSRGPKTCFAKAIVRNALDELNDRQRLALLLHKFEGMSYADIGESMELSPAAVKSLLSRARESLRGKLEPYVK